MRLAVLLDGSDFAEWRAQARALLREHIEPADVHWQVGDAAGLLPVEPAQASAVQWQAGDAAGLLPVETGQVSATARTGSAATHAGVPREFLALADTVLAHADPRRHAVLYRLLWRLVHGERHLLGMATDDDVAWTERAAKAVRRDLHKMKAFVRFREVQGAQGSVFVAWFEPAHAILVRVAPFFVRRFAGMHWSILTPTRSAHWNGEALSFDAGALRSDAPDEDALEDLWRTYYANIFNPARLKVQAMEREMPVRYWKNLPEARLIPGLILSASARMDEMVRKTPTTPKKTVPAPVERTPIALPKGSLAHLRREAKQCKACPLWEPATQTVFGEGPADARIVVIGEQPGDQEDLAGRPFVGPAGQLFDRALAQAGIERDTLYITNTVKHFKFEPRGKRRLHARANAMEQAACRHWLLAELDRIKPKAIVCLGAMAAQAMFGRSFRLMEQRGTWIALDDGAQAFATVHPSYLLRLRDAGERETAFDGFVRDLELIHKIPK